MNFLTENNLTTYEDLEKPQIKYTLILTIRQKKNKGGRKANRRKCDADKTA